VLPLLVLICSVGLALALTPIVRTAALRLGVVDHPASRKMHHVPIPLLGGLAIVVSFLVVLLGVRMIYPRILGDQVGRLDGILLAGLMIGALGVYDDWRGMKATSKFAWQLVAAGIVVFGGVESALFTNPLGGSLELGWLGPVITILWIVGVTNALNLIDGLDGLAAGIAAIAALSLCSVGAVTDEPLVALASLAIAGACIGFLPFNLFPARIFLGDTGSMFLGFMLASLGALGSLKASTTTVLVLPIVVLGIPVFDTVWAILRRTSRKISPFKADRDHIHHRLVRVGLHHRHVVLVLYFVCAFLGLSAFIMVQLPNQTGFLFAVLLAMGGVLGVWALKYIEDHLDRRLAEVSTGGAPADAQKRAEGSGAGRTGPRGRKSDPPGVQIEVCEIGRLRPGFGGSSTYAMLAEEIRETLSGRLRVYDVGVFLTEERSLLVVLRLQPVGAEGKSLIQQALIRFFAQGAERWGDGERFPEFRWLEISPARKAHRIRVPGAAIL